MSREEPEEGPNGFMLIVRNLHEETQEDNLFDLFSDCGRVNNISMNLDKRTGVCKGYAFVQYEDYQDARKARNEMDGYRFMDQEIWVDWAVIEPPRRRRR
mmetsp:Transcript_34301/g.108125  ORF Transcript_34301/g.108125 Transcript_34301/m.108125 type:complete len:100 (-) Transcript_34301:62-361(-)